MLMIVDGDSVFLNLTLLSFSPRESHLWARMLLERFSAKAKRQQVSYLLAVGAIRSLFYGGRPLGAQEEYAIRFHSRMKMFLFLFCEKSGMWVI